MRIPGSGCHNHFGISALASPSNAEKTFNAGAFGSSAPTGLFGGSLDGRARLDRIATPQGLRFLEVGTVTLTEALLITTYRALVRSITIIDHSTVIDLKRMRSFVVLAEELHFGRAAAKLNIVQPALTQQIRHLEEGLGVDLLDRSSRRVALTAPGEVFLVEARKVLLQVDLAEQSARDTGKGLAGTLNVGFVDNAVWSVLPRVLRAFRTAVPRVELNLKQMARAPQLAALLQGELDIAVMPGPVGRAGVSTRLLSRAPIDVALPSGHALCELTEVPFKRLESEPFVAFPSAVDVRRIDELIFAMCAQAGFTPILGQAVQQMHTALALVSTGAGVAVVPRWMRRAWLDNIEYRPLKPTAEYDLLIVTCDTRTRQTVTRFCDVATDFVRADSENQEDFL